jgi:hypothetical protein
MHKDFLNSLYSILILYALNLSIVHNLNISGRRNIFYFPAWQTIFHTKFMGMFVIVAVLNFIFLPLDISHEY